MNNCLDFINNFKYLNQLNESKEAQAFTSVQSLTIYFLAEFLHMKIDGWPPIGQESMFLCTYVNENISDVFRTLLEYD